MPSIFSGLDPISNSSGSSLDQEELNKLKTTLGNENLNTTSQTLTGAINEIKDLTDIGDSKIQTVVTDVDNNKTKIAEHTSQLNEIKYYVTPQMFGAVGDGTADDTVALQNAVNYCITNKCKLISKGNYIYLIAQPIVVDTCDIDFNRATITTNENINIFEINTNDYYGNIKNITFDCTHANSGIKVINGRKKTFKNLIFNNISNYGFHYASGYEILLQDSHFNGNGTDSSVGIYAQGGDSNFEDIILIDCYKAIINRGMNYFRSIHAWMKTKTILNGSTMFELLNSVAYVINCYSDTYYITFNNNGGYVIANANKIFFNDTIYLENEERPYVFFFTGDSNSNRNSFINSDVIGVRSAQTINFSNNTNPKIKVNNNNLVWVSGYTGGITLEQTGQSSSITQITTNITTIKNGFVNINLVFELDLAVSSYFSFDDIPVPYRPTKAYNCCCAVGNSQWTVNEVGYLYIQYKITGQIKDDGSGSKKWVKINVTYPIANENY